MKIISEQEEHDWLLICKNNWVRNIAGVKRVERRRMDELRGEIGVQMSLTERLVKFRLRWAGLLVQMGEEGMVRRVHSLREQGRRKRGGPWMSWEDCVRRDIHKVGRVESGASRLKKMKLFLNHKLIRFADGDKPIAEPDFSLLVHGVNIIMG